jgi:hypothetical protein
MVTGSFHADFHDAAVARLKIRAPERSILTVRIADVSDYTDDEIPGLLVDPTYGPVADYVLFVNSNP